eukprot:6179795-Pleurochrysis_carterae.AAC.3
MCDHTLACEHELAWFQCARPRFCSPVHERVLATHPAELGLLALHLVIQPPACLPACLPQRGAAAGQRSAIDPCDGARVSVSFAGSYLPLLTIRWGSFRRLSHGRVRRSAWLPTDAQMLLNREERADARASDMC